MDLQPNNFNSPNDRFTYREQHAHRHDVMQRIIEITGSILVALLGFRFIFALLGANPLNGFASFIYSFTAPFTAPFYNLFSYDHPTLGIATFEGYTLVAMGAYALLSEILVRLISVTRY
jgi:hypothetical protein